VPQLQQLMRFICRNGFEHHAAMNASHSAGVLAEAMETYLGWDVHRHSWAPTMERLQNTGALRQ
jgi:L-fucose isomerase-like protein